MPGTTIFLDARMQGQGIKTFLDVDLTQTIDSFMDIVKNREGVLGVSWIRMSNGKVITGTSHGHLKLSDFGFYNEMTLHASLRLKGGSISILENMFQKLRLQIGSKFPFKKSSRKFNETEVQKFGGTVVTEDCIIGCGSVCYNKSQSKCRVQCGCVYCSECMVMCINKQLNEKCQPDIKCNICSSVIDSVLAYEIAAYSDKEKCDTDNLLFRNSLKIPKSLISECSNLSCKQLITEQPLNGNKLICSSCSIATCHICKLKWMNTDISNNKIFCGNDVCDPSVIYKTFLDDAKTKKIGDIEVTDTRICTACFGINLHEIACKHITCPCGYEYCHICLQPWNGHQSDSCQVEEKQTISKEMILNIKI